MAIVDEQGRLFGRFNVVDTVVAVFVLALIPFLYGAAALFWSPVPKLTAITPASVAYGPGQRVTIQGENLRPYMRVSFGPHQGRDFQFKSTTEADITLNEMPAGVYDVILYDVAQEHSRLAQALTIQVSPLPRTRMIMVGVFGNLDAARAAELKPGTMVKGLGIIRKVDTPMPSRVRVSSNGLNVEIPIDSAVMLPAEVEAFCEVRPLGGTPFCQIDGVTVQATMMLMGEHGTSKLPFQIDQVRGAEALEPIEAVVQMVGAPAVIAQLRVGDVDRGGSSNPLAAGGTITQIGSRSTSGANQTAIVTMRLSAERGSNGWVYASRPLHAGTTVTLRTPRYELNGYVQKLTPEWTSATRP
jgi:hypothetical protein